MASDTNLNGIIGQGFAVKEIFNAKKQALELQQHFSSHHMEVKKKQDKVTVQTFSAENAIEERDSSHTSQEKDRKNRREKEERQPDHPIHEEGHLLDIEV